MYGGDMNDPQQNGRPFIGQHPRSEKGGSYEDPSNTQYRDPDKNYYSDGQSDRGYDPRYQDPEPAQRSYDHRGSDPRIDGRGSDPRMDSRGSDPRIDPRGSDPRINERHGSDPRIDRHGSDPRIDRHGSDPRIDRPVPEPRSDRRYRDQSDDPRSERRHRGSTEELDPRSDRRHRDPDQGAPPRGERRHRDEDQGGQPPSRSDRYLKEGGADGEPRRQRRSPQAPRRSPQQPRRAQQGPRPNSRQGGQRGEASRRRSGQGPNSEGDASWSSGNSTESQQHQLEADCKVFMNDLVYRIFNQSSTISQEDNAAFGTFCRPVLCCAARGDREERPETKCCRLCTAFGMDIDEAGWRASFKYSVGRQWFARLVDAERVNSQKVSEQTFYRLVQFFAVCLFECNEADDFTPAKSLMNMCFTFYHDHEGFPVSNDKITKSFLYTHLTEQPIWKSLRFWNASFFDAVHCERKQRSPDDRGNWRQQSHEERASTETQDENITFGQLATFLHNMMELGLTRETTIAFLDKQSIIGNLSPDQTELLQGNVEHYYREKSLQELQAKRLRQQKQQRNQIQRPRTLQKNQMQMNHQQQQQQQQQQYENPVQKFGQFLRFQLNALSSTR